MNKKLENVAGVHTHTHTRINELKKIENKKVIKSYNFIDSG